MEKILITGATGNLGRAVIESLLKTIPANQVVALTRDENKAADLKEKGVELRLGDYDDIASLHNAMEGIGKVLLISGGRAQNGLEQHQNVVDAAKKAGVKCIAYTGRCLKDRNTLANQLMKRHFETEDYIKNSGLNYILFRNILYMDAMVLLLGKDVLETGINQPAGDGIASYALRSDMGEAIGNVLANYDCDNRILDFTNSETYSFYDIAAALSELSGKNVIYTPVDPDVFLQVAMKRGLPEFVANMSLGFMTDIKNGQESKVSKDLEIILGRKPASLKEGLKILFNL
ncbi:NAD(P)H dehydrogenase (quinone) [Mucilaginibacter sp. UYP25]|uniref:SDR family oxidoreductase n=1 Tax=unclassified Mucilaginibacter TaxID=2617802 RepID=UPI0033970ABD